MAVASASEKPCSQFDALVETTYDFRPSLLDDAARTRKATEMDGVWQMVQKNPAPLIPCLRSALNRRTTDSWFAFDGSQLLVSVDPSRESKASLLDAMARALAERYATPALVALCRTTSGQATEAAAWLLMSQATPEALRAVKTLDPVGLSSKAMASRKALLEHPSLLVPRASPKTTRKDFLLAFNAFVGGDSRPFERLVDGVPDGERDVVAVCKPEDLDLIRKVRRRFIARANQHAIEYYNVFSQILMTMVWRPEMSPPKS